MMHLKLLCALIVSAIAFASLSYDVSNVYRVGVKKFHKAKLSHLTNEEFSFAITITWLILILFGVATTVLAALYIKIL